MIECSVRVEPLRNRDTLSCPRRAAGLRILPRFLPPDERRYISDTGPGFGIDRYLRPRVTTARFEGDNEVAIQTMGAGGYRLSLSVVNTTTRRSHPIPGFEPTRVELTGEDRQVLELRVSAEGLAEALQHVR